MLCLRLEGAHPASDLTCIVSSDIDIQTTFNNTFSSLPEFDNYTTKEETYSLQIISS